MKPVPLALLALAAALHAEDTPPPEARPDAVLEDSSYALGFRSGGDFAEQFGAFGITPADLDRERFLKGFFDAFEGRDPELDDDTLDLAMQALGDLLQKREQRIAAENLEKGRAFLEENAAREEVVTTDSGLQYEVLEAGGDERYAEPGEGEPEQQFFIRYRGTLIDGTEFDASPEDETVPMTRRVIDGIREALETMPVGARWRIFVPSELAYGDQRRSSLIGPNSTLIFEIELEKIDDMPPHPGGLPLAQPESD